MCRKGTCRDCATLVREKRGRVVVGTERAVRMSPEEGVEGQGEDALPCCERVQWLSYSSCFQR